ncbi:hypothetical protein PV791_04550 [Priestia filamentosa]|uniref:hypothetical protein n=1 Tax=Priestia TaxID=2800373 RepID=UPI000DCA7801|nr:hypothetical protein [Priestia endophytica]RAS91285.1 hypothetical protein A3863_06310 [Priestia endophytica]
MSWDEVIFHKCNDDRKRHEDKRHFFEDNMSWGRKRNDDEDKEKERENREALDFTGKGRKSLFGLTIGATVSVTLSNAVELEGIFQGIVGDYALILVDTELVRVNLKDIVTVSVI